VAPSWAVVTGSTTDVNPAATVVVGARVVGAPVVGATDVGATVVGATVAGATVVGATVLLVVVGGAASTPWWPAPQAATVNNDAAMSSFADRPKYHGGPGSSDELTMAKPTSPTSTVRGIALASGLVVAVVACGSARPSSHATATTSMPPTPVPTTTIAAPVPTTTTAPPTTAPPTTAVAAAPISRTTLAAPTCATNLAADLASTGRASQLVTVEAPTYDTTTATVELWQREGACWESVAGPWSGRIGANGFSDHHVEGDNTTPTGLYGIGSTIYGNAPNPGVHYAYHDLVCGDWWDEDPSSPEYNTFQHVPCGQTPSFGGGSEALWQETAAYPSFAVVDYNTDPIVSGAGSAIFVHADTGGPTAGCVSLPLSELDDLLQWLEPAQSPLIVMGPTSEIDRF